MRITACLLLLLALPQLSLAQDRTLEDVLHEQDTLFMIVNEGGDEFDDSNSSFPATGYINSAGDTIIPYGKYEYCFNEFFVHYTIVLLKNEVGVRPVAIDRKENILFEVMWFDNGPDWIEDGLFRIIKDENIGYANEKGEIVIKPQFACAEQFEEGMARVTFDCELIPDGEHTAMKSDSWFYIDKKGNRIPD